MNHADVADTVCALDVSDIRRVSLDGEPLPRLASALSNMRAVYALPDSPHVVKVEILEPGWSSHRQCVTEFYSWHERLSCSELQHLFAATRLLVLAPSPAGVVAMSVQDRVHGGDNAPPMRVNGDYYRMMNDAGLHVSDLREDQYMYHAERGHYVLVDYGVCGDWRIDERYNVRAKLLLEEVRMSEKVLVKDGVDG